MMGTGAFAEPTFQALLAGVHPVVGLVTNPDRPSGREREMLRGMKKIALEHGIPVFQPEKINTPEGVEGMQAFQPDLLVVAAYGQILSRDVLGTARQGGINVHASLLPKYRGAAPIAWAIYHGETRTGVTIIRMSTAMDAGDLLAQEATDIGPEETAGEVEARLASIGARMALRIIQQMAQGPVPGVKQDITQVTKAPKLTKEHGLIDWTRSGRDICNHIRAMQPWPTSYTFWHAPGQEPIRMILKKAAWGSQDEGETHQAGEVLPAGDEGRLRVIAGAGTWVEILELQPAGKRRMAAAEFLRGHPVHAGVFLDPPPS